jgi:hypothetical protein
MDPTLLTWDGYEWVVAGIHPVVTGALLPVAAAVAAVIWAGLVLVAFKKNSNWVSGSRNRRRP